MATHSSVFAWKIPWREEPGGIQSMGLQGVGYNCLLLHAMSCVMSCERYKDEMIQLFPWLAGNLVK